MLTNVHVDTTKVYDSTGEFVGEVTFRAVEHHTMIDGVVRVDLKLETLTCDI